jgi:hypothetical protein
MLFGENVVWGNVVWGTGAVPVFRPKGQSKALISLKTLAGFEPRSSSPEADAMSTAPLRQGNVRLCQHIRVTRLGEFSQFGCLFITCRFFKLIKSFTYIVKSSYLHIPRLKSCINSDKKWLGILFG